MSGRSERRWLLKEKERLQPVKKTTPALENRKHTSKPNDIAKSEFQKYKIPILRTIAKIAKLVGFVFLVLGGIVSCIAIYQRCFKSQSTKYDEEHIIEKDMRPPKISDKTNIETPNEFYYNKFTYKYPIVNGIYIKDLSKKEYLNFYMGLSIKQT
jgi:hypothetical protein